MTYYGYKFESLATSDKPLDPNDHHGQMERDEAPVNTNVQFCSVFSSKLGRSSLLLGGEVDCLVNGQYTHEKPGEYTYAELKTNRIITSERQEQKFIQ